MGLHVLKSMVDQIGAQTSQCTDLLIRLHGSGESPCGPLATESCLNYA